jgi:hypothetical protein
MNLSPIFQSQLRESLLRLRRGGGTEDVDEALSAARAYGKLAGISIVTSVPRPGLLTTVNSAWLP